MNMRIAALAGATVLLGLGLACSPDRSPDVPNGTPDCTETCEAAWACGGVLENDLEACVAQCDDEEHGPYRVCISETVCEEMWECKILGPGEVGGGDDTDAT